MDTETQDEKKQQARAVLAFGALDAFRELMRQGGLSPEETRDALLAYAVGQFHEGGHTEPDFLAICAEAAEEQWAGGVVTAADPDRGRTAPVESPRISTEQRCRELGHSLRAQLRPHGQGFVLLVFDQGQKPGNVAFLSTIPREKSAHLLTEMTDHWLEHEGISAEPSVHTSSILRELVSQMTPEDLQPVRPHEGRIKHEGRRVEGLAAHLEAAAHHLACFARDQLKVKDVIRQETAN